MQIKPYFTWTYIRERFAHGGFQRYFRNAGWMLFARLANMGIALIATAYIARNLGPSNYGQLSYALSYVGIFSFIAALGLDQILCRDLVRFPEKRNAYMGTAVGLRFIASVFTVIVCVGSAYLWSSKDVSLWLIFIVSMGFIFSTFQLVSYEFQAEAKLKFPSILSIIVIVILNLAKIFVIYSGQGVIYLAGITLLEPILYAIGLLFLRTREYGTVRHWTFDMTIAKSLLKDSFPLIFASAFYSIYARIDQVMVKNALGPESVGLYDSAVRISELWYFIPHIVMTTLLPAIINAKSTSNELYLRRTKRLYLLIVGLSILTALVTAFLSKFLILTIFGIGFIGALSVLQIYVWSNVGAALNLVTQQMLIAENMTRTITLTAFLGMAANVALNIVLIPKYGMSGAAIASLISYLVPTLALFFFKRTRKLILEIIR